jgi:uncharacterized protein YjbI with pentapeptide repeats
MSDSHSVLVTSYPIHPSAWRNCLENREGGVYNVVQITDLSGTNLEGADLSNADLSGTNLEGADLTSAYLRYADLSGAEGVTGEQLEQQAKSLKGATMPNGQKYEDWAQ